MPRSQLYGSALLIVSPQGFGKLGIRIQLLAGLDTDITEVLYGGDVEMEYSRSSAESEVSAALRFGILQAVNQGGFHPTSRSLRV